MNEISHYLRRLCRFVDANRHAIRLCLIVNKKSSYHLPDDYHEFSVATEYMSDVELDQILDGFRDSGILTDLFIGEGQFVSALLSGSLGSDGRYLVVYNTVTSGTWHGRDSLVSALCGFSGHGYCGSDAYAMGVAGNKYYALRLAEGRGISTGGLWLYLPTKKWVHSERPRNGLRVIIKPALECASIGIDQHAVRVVDDDLETWLTERSAMFRQPLLVQAFMAGYEAEVPVYSASRPVAPIALGISLHERRLLGDEILTYERVYADDYAYYPLGDLDPKLEHQLTTAALTVHTELNLHGFSRVDFRIGQDSRFVVTDINAIPHLTARSACALAFQQLGISHSNLLKLVVAAGLAGRRQRSATDGTTLECL